MSRLTRDEWRRLVFGSQDPRMTPAVKVLCLYLADHMTAERHVSVPRAVIATALGVHEQRVAERLKKAVEAEYLVHVRVGHVGRTAEYQGTRPDALQHRVRTAPQDPSKTRLAVRTSEADPINGGAERTAPRDANKTDVPISRHVTPELVQDVPVEIHDKDALKSRAS